MRGAAVLPFLVAIAAAAAAIVIVVNAVATSLRQRRSQIQPPPRPGGHALEAQRRGGAGPVPPSPRTDQARADLRAHKSRPRQRHIPTRTGRASGSVRPTPGTI
jgi:hypothetical protein